ncbi:MAG: DUF3108 domain-containing protein [Bacteroidetes bacterium]|nr:DUF3108 domain-containing protein [Bacteroidota bacterium]
MKNKLIIVSLSAFLAIFIMAFKTDTLAVKNTDQDEFAFRKMTNTAFAVNEKLEFRVHYGIINAASISMEVDANTEDVYARKCYHIKAEGKTLKSFDWAFKVRDKFDTYLDEEALVPIKFTKAVQEDNYKDDDLVVFKHPKKKLYSKKGDLAMPLYTQDVISALYYIRNIDFESAKVNQQFPLDVYLDNKIYNLGFKYVGKETLKTDVGTVKCIKLVPTLIVDRVFKSKDDMTVWISDDANKIPIRAKAEIMVGSVKIDITKYSGLKNEFKALTKKK